MKRILFIANNNVGNGFSGGDRIFVEFLRFWSQQCDITLQGSEEAIKITQDRGVDKQVRFIKSDSVNSGNYFSLLGTFRHLLRRLWKGIKSLPCSADYQIVYSVSDFYPDLLSAWWFKRKNPDIVWVAGYYLFAPPPFSKDSPYKGIKRVKGLLYWLMQFPSYRLVRSKADYVFVTSVPDVDKFVTSTRTKEKIVVVQGGVNVEKSEKYLSSKQVMPVHQRKYDACFVGRFHAQKGVLGLIEIWKYVVSYKPDAKLAIIGDGELESELRTKIRRIGLQGNIELLGFLDGVLKFEIFKDSKVILHPAVYDSGGMAAAEGMAWGLPGVSFDLESLKTYYPKGMLKVACFDNKGFALQILTLLSDTRLYEETSRDARDLIVSIWDWKVRSQKILDCII